MSYEMKSILYVFEKTQSLQLSKIWELGFGVLTEKSLLSMAKGDVMELVGADGETTKLMVVNDDVAD
ncbi:hypothetical protein GUITHDRAFT_103948 [Guillardia theta CCMP2712]|uniref:Uncharacterized protein n=1 Tax=Guillardia theta (strain CCMP2712) TaxID=905079 RepID=L1JPC3_GUITC|nr:hypothetical protein GUITHDRAFT_103948 [Guillardia theta CCMP2712]EKX50134.1 hypothetical protein GUITHDRAFT_103948 [Guillardia theta CCMP2712]|eukprot:XP_005837114.1 hypothetical protein GUITHDRAFT_103948 [Guillardia theta CCMP2712]